MGLNVYEATETSSHGPGNEIVEHKVKLFCKENKVKKEWANKN